MWPAPHHASCTKTDYIPSPTINQNKVLWTVLCQPDTSQSLWEEGALVEKDQIVGKSVGNFIN